MCVIGVYSQSKNVCSWGSLLSKKNTVKISALVHYHNRFTLLHGPNFFCPVRPNGKSAAILFTSDGTTTHPTVSDVFPYHTMIRVLNWPGVNLYIHVIFWSIIRSFHSTLITVNHVSNCIHVFDMIHVKWFGFLS